MSEKNEKLIVKNEELGGMRFRYRSEEEMKDSGVEWLGKIPSEWNNIKLRNLGIISTSSVDKKTDENESVVSLVNYVDIYNSKSKELYNNFDYMKVSAKEKQLETCNLVKGDVLFTPSSETIEDIGYSSVVMEDLINTLYSYHIVRLRFKEEIYLNFKKYMFWSNSFLNYLSSRATGTTRKTLSLNDFKDNTVVIPSLDEQKDIANFLDEKTTQFDSIISKKEDLIERLEEAKKSLINEVVTGKVKVVKTDDGYELAERSMDEMRDSGVEWLGDVPTIFQVSKMKYVSDVIDPQPDHRAPKLAEGEGFPYIGIRDLNFDGTINVQTARKVEEEAIIKQEKAFSIDEGDLVFGKVGTLGNPKFIQPHTRIALSATLVLIKCKSNVINRYLRYVLDSKVIEKQMQYLAQGSTRPALGIQQIRKFDLPYPKLDQQILIADYLDLQIQSIELLCIKTQKQIEKLKQAKQSLISEVVTGKIEVLE